MKSKAEIVVETLRHYNLKNRGYNSEFDNCTYLDKSTGNKCAVGRCILDSEIEKVSEYEQNVYKENRINKTSISPTVTNLVENFADLDSLLKPEYRGHDIDFWENLQYIHDRSLFWNEDGFDHSINMTFIAAAFGKEVAEAVKAAFAEKTA